jgi:hypothetical protein
MKKTVKVLALALVAMSLSVACNNNNTTEEVIDTVVPVDTTVIEEVVDTVPTEEVVAEEPVKKATPAKKKAAKKEEPKTEVKVDASKMTISTKKGSATISNNGVSTKGKNSEGSVDASK